ncbi:MAG: ketopantoate reductase family protein [Collinsella sp.]
MQINKVAFIGKGGVGLLYGSMIARALGNDAVEYIMDDTRFERHAGDALTVNGKPCDLTSVRASEATPADLVILTVKTTGLDQALKTMERVVGPNAHRLAMQRHYERAKDCRTLWLGAYRSWYLPGHGRRVPQRRAHLYQCGRDPLWRGGRHGPATVAAIDGLYTRCGIAHTVEDDIAHRMWAKLMLNDGINQTCMAYGGTYGSATEPAPSSVAALFPPCAKRLRSPTPRALS